MSQLISIATSSTCREPSNLPLMAERTRWAQSSEFQVSGDIFLMPSDCVNQPSLDAADGVKDRSLCPWTYKINRDVNRIPSLISEARCCCTTCFGSHGDDVCEPIYVTKRVFIRTSNICNANGEYQYTPAHHNFVVGCTCAKRPVGFF